MSMVQDPWRTGSEYEDFMGRWSRQLAPKFVSWLQPAPSVHWLDVGCGTGSLANAVCLHAEPGSVVGCDPAQSFIDYARSHSPDGCASFVLAGIGSLPRRRGGYGSITSLLALNFFPDLEAALHEMRSLTRNRGTVSACVWDYAGRMDLLRYFWDSVGDSDARAQMQDEGRRFTLCRPEPLEKLFRGSGLHDVLCEPLEICAVFTDFDDYWNPFLGGTGPAPAYVASLEPDEREALRERLENSIPRGSGGTITLLARAWAVKGVVP